MSETLTGEAPGLRDPLLSEQVRLRATYPEMLESEGGNNIFWDRAFEISQLHTDAEPSPNC